MSKFLNKVTGDVGEKQAKQFLKAKKYKIIKTNYKNSLGEIDIIAKKNGVIVFVEVKTKTSKTFGLPEEMVTKNKQNKIKKVATYYLKQNNMLNASSRCDVIAILEGDIKHLKNAF
jgi:putative endonuclease